MIMGGWCRVDLSSAMLPRSLKDQLLLQEYVRRRVLVDSLFELFQHPITSMLMVLFYLLGGFLQSTLH